jgi:hypothetical protein
VRKRQAATIIEPDPSHPLSWDNPANEEVWLDLARAIGRQIARDQRDGLKGPIEGENEHSGETRCHLRSVFEQDANKAVDRGSDHGLPPSSGKARSNRH